MFEVITEKNNLRVEGAELLTSGSVNINYIQLHTSDDWLGLNRVILFRTNQVTIAINIGIDYGEDYTMPIPWEVLDVAKETIQVGLYGTSADDTTDIILPTIWGTIGKVVQGVFISGFVRPGPTDEVLEQVLTRLDSIEKKLDSEPQFEFMTDAEVDQIIAANQNGSGRMSYAKR